MISTLLSIFQFISRLGMKVVSCKSTTGLGLVTRLGDICCWSLLLSVQNIKGVIQGLNVFILLLVVQQWLSKKLWPLTGWLITERPSTRRALNWRLLKLVSVWQSDRSGRALLALSDKNFWALKFWLNLRLVLSIVIQLFRGIRKINKIVLIAILLPKQLLVVAGNVSPLQLTLPRKLHRAAEIVELNRTTLWVYVGVPQN